jgi:hypothetical protein
MEYTTSLNDLPPPDINMPTSYDLPEHNIKHSSREMDDQIQIQREPPRMTKPQTDEDIEPVNTITKKAINNSSRFSDVHKVIILATIYFLLFTDIKVRTYIINILVVIFGNFLRTPLGGTSKIGWVFYSIVFGLSLYSTVSMIDLSSYSLKF